MISLSFFFFFFQAEDGIRDLTVTGVQTCALPISRPRPARARESSRAEESRGPQREDDGHRREDREHREAGEQDLAERVEQAHQQAAEQRALEAAEAADDDDDEGEQQDLEIGAGIDADERPADDPAERDRKSTRLNSSHSQISYAVFCLKKK